MKKKKVISTIVLFALALSSCKGCPSDPTKRSDTNVRKTLTENERMLTEIDKLYSDAQVALDAVRKASEALDRFQQNSNLSFAKAEAYETVAKAFDRLALILDSDESKNCNFTTIHARINNTDTELSAEYCRTMARQKRVMAERIRDMAGGRVDPLVLLVSHEPMEDCSICLGTLKNPLACPVCRKQFCHDCIAGWLLHNPSCPCCRGTAEKLLQIKVSKGLKIP